MGAVEAGGRGPQEGRLLETGGRGRRQGVTRLALTLLLSGLARPLGTEVTPRFRAEPAEAPAWPLLAVTAFLCTR